MKMKSMTVSSFLFVLIVSLLASADAGCSDDDDFTFTGDFSGSRDCEWLGEKSNRQDKYCDRPCSSSKGSKGSSYKKIKKYCKKACGICDDDDDTAAPSMVPSTSSMPSLMPSGYDDDVPLKKCKDKNSFKFETEFKGVKDCHWLSQKAKRQYKYCETRGWDGEASKKVKYSCRKSCANFLEGDQFDKCDKFEDDDYVEEVRPPYDEDDDDVIDDCKDEKNFKFKTEHAGMKKCKWLAKKEDRKEKYCETQGWNNAGDRKVKFACKYSCGCFGTRFYNRVV